MKLKYYISSLIFFSGLVGIENSSKKSFNLYIHEPLSKHVEKFIKNRKHNFEDNKVVHFYTSTAKKNTNVLSNVTFFDK